jgi:hypothetical protein
MNEATATPIMLLMNWNPALRRSGARRDRSSLVARDGNTPQAQTNVRPNWGAAARKRTATSFTLSGGCSTPFCAGSSVSSKNRSMPAGVKVSTIRADFVPVLWKQCTVPRGTFTKSPGPAVTVLSPRGNSICPLDQVEGLVLARVDMRGRTAAAGRHRRFHRKIRARRLLAGHEKRVAVAGTQVGEPGIDRSVQKEIRTCVCS